jgi:hypothetical protein
MPVEVDLLGFPEPILLARMTLLLARIASFGAD